MSGFKMHESIKISFFKLLIFSFTLLMAIGFLKFIAFYRNNTSENISRYLETDKTKPKVIFLGSSRVQKGFDTKKINSSSLGDKLWPV
mgnify:CR=1 FL=1